MGVLVHKAFNVSIIKEDDCEEWLGDFVYVGQTVKFTVTHLDFKGKLPFIRGKLIAEYETFSSFLSLLLNPSPRTTNQGGYPPRPNFELRSLVSFSPLLGI